MQAQGNRILVYSVDDDQSIRELHVLGKVNEIMSLGNGEIIALKLNFLKIAINILFLFLIGNGNLLLYFNLHLSSSIVHIMPVLGEIVKGLPYNRIDLR